VAAGLIGWNEIGNIANDEQIAGIAIRNDCGVDARIAARNDHDSGRLALARQALVQAILGVEMLVTESLESVYKL
jgi:hypothetical protein